ncbi:MAG TPA: fibronectin type III domain-containing protein, partial [Bacteroidia bacterium]|nr:fibronectin type III domain-containing protein [Bacteroidia bacterium]
MTTILLFYFPVLTFASDCKPPVNITITDVTSSSAQVSWNIVKPGSSYQLQIITTSGKSNTLLASNNSLQLTALYPMTTYMVSIRSICGDDT